MLAQIPEMFVLFFEFGFVGGGEVGFDFAEDVCVYQRSVSRQSNSYSRERGGEGLGGS